MSISESTTESAPESLVSEAEPTDDCVHHWMLTAPRHQITSAVCKLCGAERDFLDTPRSAYGSRRAQ
jgi:hypothetical protein